MVLSFLEKIPLFQHCTTSELEEIGRNLKRQRFQRGEIVFNQGDLGDSFYIIADGTAEVLIRSNGDATSGPGSESGSSDAKISSIFMSQFEMVKVVVESLTFPDGTIISRGTKCRVEKFDPSREYPYTIVVCDPNYKTNSVRGRVLPDEIMPVDMSKLVVRKIGVLGPGDYFGEECLIKGGTRNATVRVVGGNYNNNNNQRTRRNSQIRKNSLHGPGDSRDAVPGSDQNPLAGLSSYSVNSIQPINYNNPAVGREDSSLIGATNSSSSSDYLECAVIDAEVFRDLNLGTTLTFQKRLAVNSLDHYLTWKNRGPTDKTKEECTMIRSAIKSNKKLTELVALEDQYLNHLISQAWKKNCMHGQIIIQQGDTSSEEFFIIRQGDFDVYVDDDSNDRASGGGPGFFDPDNELNKPNRSHVGTIKEGASFGELALLYQSPRPATIQCASQQGSLFVIERSAFKDTLRIANTEKRQRFVDVLDQVALFDCLLMEEKQLLAESLVEVHFLENENIITEGTRGETFYILYQGQVTFTKKDTETGEDRVVAFMDAQNYYTGNPGVPIDPKKPVKKVENKENNNDKVEIDTKSISFFQNQNVAQNLNKDPQQRGCYFGERSLLKKELRAASATVTSVTASALILTKERFENLLGSLQGLMDQKHLKQERAKQLGLIIGPDGTLVKKPKETDRDSRFADLDRQRKLYCSNQIGNTNVFNNVFNMDPTLDKREDLKTISLLGVGGFGVVSLEQNTITGKTYALKRLSKGYLEKCKMQEATLREKEVMILCNSSEFLIKLFNTYKDTQYLYLLMEAALGGELYSIYHKQRFHGDVDKARFYSASVIYAFQHLHDMNVIYRDLKPENLLLDSNGYPKLSDFGLSKVVIGLGGLGKTYTTCGTPEYFAPEVIQQSGTSRGADWWTLGIFIHELMCGHTPFESDSEGSNDDVLGLYQRIVRGASTIFYPYGKDKDCVSLVKSLLKSNAPERLPMRYGGINNLKIHPWWSNSNTSTSQSSGLTDIQKETSKAFPGSQCDLPSVVRQKPFDWAKLFNRTLPVPYKPKVRDRCDGSNYFQSDGKGGLESEMPPNVYYEEEAERGEEWDRDF